MEWNGLENLNRSDRTVFVLGFHRGYAAGMRDGLKEAAEPFMAANPASSWTPEVRQKLKEKAEEIDQKSAPKQVATIQQIEAAVSAFYEDYKNTNVCWGNTVLFSTASLHGNAPTEQELLAARTSGTESGCKRATATSFRNRLPQSVTSEQP
jgi:hypothetical protein